MYRAQKKSILVIWAEFQTKHAGQHEKDWLRPDFSFGSSINAEKV